MVAGLGLVGWGAASSSSSSFRNRRVKAVKERLTSTLKKMQASAAGSAKGTGKETLPLFDRPCAASVVASIAETAGLYMQCTPKGEGKSSLMELLAQQYPFIAYADLQNGSIDQAVRALAAAIGYSLDYTLDELAAKAAGFTVPAINAQQGISDLEELLLVFEQACRELREEGTVGSRVPVLILDHANRPKPGPKEDPTASFIYTLVEIGHRIANKRIASWGAVTSDPQQDHEAWTHAGERDSLAPLRVPPFSEDEACELLARAIFDRRHPQVTPTAAKLNAIKAEYAATLKFICGAAGTRARWLLCLLQLRKVPLSDSDLKGEGVAVAPAFYPYLSAGLHSSDLRVDPLVWQQFCSLVRERKAVLKPLMEVCYNFQLPPVQAAAPSPEELTADRVLATDAALRDLLQAAERKGAAEEKSAPVVQAVPEGLSFEALRDKHFRDRDEDLRALCAKHVLFYNHGTRAVEFESELMRRITASWLAEPRHKQIMQLVRKLREWQEANGAQAGAKEALLARKGTWAVASGLVAKLSSAEERVAQLEGEIEALRGQLCLLRKD